MLNSLEFYKELFEKLPTAIILTEVDSYKIVDANNSAIKFLSYSLEELKTKDFFELFEKNKDSDFFQLINAQEKSASTYEDIIEYELNILDKNKNTLPIEITSTLIEIKNKKLIVYYLKDLVIRKEHENINYYYDKALKKSSTYLALIDMNYAYKAVNESYCKTFNLEKVEIIGKTIREIIGADYFDKKIKEKIDLALSGQTVEYEYEYSINNRNLYLKAHYEPYYHLDDTIKGAVITVYDLSKYKEYEQENIKKEKLLVQQSKMAAMGEMLENIAHQWRQPLSVISTSASGIIMQKQYNSLENDFLEEHLSNIVNTSTFLSNTIDDFKNFFQKENIKEKYFLNTILDKTISLIKIHLTNNNIEIIRDYKEELEIFNYKNELMQVLLNILNNAIDAIILNEEIKDKKKCIYIKIYKQNNESIIEIIDNAGGIKDNVIDKIFEPYFTTKHQYQGTGIGLFMTREIITKHMLGSINVKNKSFTYKNENFYGASFKISL